jgi:hypothetical protein
VQFVILPDITVANPCAHSKHNGFVLEEQETQFGGQSLQTPSTNVAPTLQLKQIEKLLLKQETQIS